MSNVYRELTYPSADGLALFCRDYEPVSPRGTVVCLPGLTRNSRDFVKIAEHLADRYRVLTPDLRGRGRSQWDASPLTNYHPAVYQRDIVKLLTDEVPGKAAIIGTSLGGILAMSLASTAVDPAVAARIAGIVVNDIGPELAKEGAKRIAGYVGKRVAPRTWPEAVEQTKEYYAETFPDFDDAAWLGHVKALYREREDGTITADYDPAIGDAMRATSSRTFDLWDVWKAIEVPVLAVRGTRSDLLSAATFDRMLAEKPGLARVELANRGHAPQLIEPDALAAIDAFLARLFPGPLVAEAGAQR
jgi:pimeloyl-ACP methyl ester carboxylesterase